MNKDGLKTVVVGAVIIVLGFVLNTTGYYVKLWRVIPLNGILVMIIGGVILLIGIGQVFLVHPAASTPVGPSLLPDPAAQDAAPAAPAAPYAAPDAPAAPQAPPVA